MIADRKDPGGWLLLMLRLGEGGAGEEVGCAMCGLQGECQRKWHLKHRKEDDHVGEKGSRKTVGPKQ